MTFLATTDTQVVFYAAFALWFAFTFLIEPMIIRSPSTKTAKKRRQKVGVTDLPQRIRPSLHSEDFSCTFKLN
jgi:hypothetical protein